jgi:hypothetical protein
MKTPRSLWTCLAVSAMAASLHAGAQNVRVNTAPFMDAPMLPFAPAARPRSNGNLTLGDPSETSAIRSPADAVALPVAHAAQSRPQATFALLAEDRTVRSAFLRWADQAKAQVVWQVDGDIPLDATGTVVGASLADAMTQVAAAFVDKKLPFVIREYDNAIVVLSRWSVRP